MTVFTGAASSPRPAGPVFKAIKAGCVRSKRALCSRVGWGGAWLGGGRGHAMPLPRTARRAQNNQLPPASPAAHELDVQNSDVTVFLIGAYAKYNWPYVWVRGPSASDGAVRSTQASALWVATHARPCGGCGGTACAAPVGAPAEHGGGHGRAARPAQHQELEVQRSGTGACDAQGAGLLGRASDERSWHAPGYCAQACGCGTLWPSWCASTCTRRPPTRLPSALRRSAKCQTSSAPCR